MTILPKKKVAKERLEDRSGSRPHGTLHSSANQLNVPGAVQYSLLSEGSSTSQNTGIGENALGHVAGPSRSNVVHRLSGPSSPTTSQILTQLNRNKKQKVFSDDDENDESDGSLENSHVPQTSVLNLSQRPGNTEEDICNSDDEQSGHQGLSAEEWAQKEAAFARLLKEKRGFVIKLMKEDGACLFRAVADQVMGDQEMHDMVRQQCMDYMVTNEDYFSQYITEDFQRYISRKRCLNAHGNHVEIQAMSEVYNRRIEVFQYDSDPINVFQGALPNENAPIRVSYHMKSHYNSVVDPYAATIGVGLGLPSLQPGLAESGLIKQAVGQSEQDVIEKQMLEDKMLATDWEATDDAIEQQIAQESYLEWLRQSEKAKSSSSYDKDTDAPSTSATKARTPEGSKPGSPKMPESPNKGHILTQMNNLPPAMFGLSDWEEEDGDLLAQVLAASQAEYLESLKPARKE